MEQSKDLLIIGDVHGCYYTLKKLVKENWNPESSLLIQVGDLVNKGPNSAQSVAYWLKLRKKYPESVFMVRGNHEQLLVQAIKRPYLYNPCNKVRSEIRKSDLNLKKVKKWLVSLPLKWENDHILITHAGVAKDAADPYRISSRQGVLYNKGPLKNIGKLQVKGHSIVEGSKPVFNSRENAWYIDTGAWNKKFLTALRLTPTGETLEIVRVETDERDKR